MTIQLISENKVAGGVHQQFEFDSVALKSTTRFAIFLPPQALQGQAVPVIYWLSGLTCSDENFMQKAGAFKTAAKLGLCIVAPDTSPRGENIPDDAAQSYDFGLGAGFYVNATQKPWATHYHMYDFVVDELPNMIENHFNVTAQRALAGHSMGGHGAMMIGLRNPDSYSSISAFSPICQPSQCPWGIKAFSGYLGSDQQTWLAYDSTELMKKIAPNQFVPVLIDQGDKDNFLAEQLTPDTLVNVATQRHYPLTFRLQEGYDHSYYFISSFIDDHLHFHHQHF